MESLRPVSLSSFSCILLHLASLAIAQPSFLYYECANGGGNYTTNSNFQRNLKSLLSSLDSNTQIDYGFYNLSVGQTGPDQANAIALSRGDIEGSPFSAQPTSLLLISTAWGADLQFQRRKKKNCLCLKRCHFGQGMTIFNLVPEVSKILFKPLIF
ncbi:hypothetical protein Peur_024400 [Populus x canadensis]